MPDFKSKYHDLLEESAIIFEKTAHYISEIESKLSNSETRANELEKEAKEHKHTAEVSEPLKKLAEAGFSDEDLQGLSNLSKDVLEKIAHASEQPVGLGSAHGMSADSADPLTKFLMS